MIRSASLASLAAVGFFCVAVEAGPLDSLKADARRLLAPPQLHLIFAGIAVGGLATRIDDELEWELPGGRFAAAAFDLTDIYGSTGKTAAAGAVLWTLAKWRDCGRVKIQSEEGLRSVAAAALLVAPLKLTTRRRRPDGSDRLSFPSGHTATAFALSTVLARRHGLRIGLPAYALAVLVPAARIGEKKHHFSDAVAGAFIGAAAGRAVGIEGSYSALEARFHPPGWRVNWRF